MSFRTTLRVISIYQLNNTVKKNDINEKYIYIFYINNYTFFKIKFI